MRYCFLRYPGGKFKAVTLSYDDGVRADLRLAALLDKYGMKATFNICSARLLADPSWNMTAEDIKTHILGAGHEVAVHGENHIAPGVGNPSVAIADILNCRRALEETFGIFVRGMAYPDSGVRTLHNGNTYENIKGYVRNLGIVYGRTLGGDSDRFMLPNDFYAWMPNAHHTNPALSEYVQRFIVLQEEKLYSDTRYPRLFYLWGHSYEFDRDDNWDLIERFCADISGKEDTWYATNIEICEYVEAYRSLVTTADGNKIYNPTVKTVWMDIDGKPYHVEPGETLVIA